MPHLVAGKRYRCAVIAICFLLSPFARPVQVVAKEVGGPAESAAQTDSVLNFQSVAKTLTVAERAGSASRASKNHAETVPPANPADMRVIAMSDGTSSRAARKAGIAAVPLNKLTAEG